MSSRGNPPSETPGEKRPARSARRKGRLGVRRRPDRRGPALAWTGSAAAHLAVIAALYWAHAALPLAEPTAIPVNLIELPKPEAPPGPPGPSGPPGPPSPSHAAPAPVQTAILKKAERRAPAARPAPVPSADAEPAPVPDTSDILSDSQLAGAADTNGEGVGAGGGGGGGGGGCDTARIVQQALQRDPLVRTAVGDAHRLGKNVMLWNGDWVRSGEQDGKGLSAVREAIVWELAFAPEACRNKRVHGMVVLSLADGNTRFAIGAGDWRWSDSAAA